jgi:hypothetical protein
MPERRAVIKVGEALITLEDLAGFELDAADPVMGGGIWVGHKCHWEIYLATQKECNLANLIDGPVLDHITSGCRDRG